MSADPELKEKADYSGTLIVEAGLATEKELREAIDDFDKPAGKRCQYQSHMKGCGIYKKRPFGCRFWTCRWLAEDDTQELLRPDKSHYVIDTQPDFLRASEDGLTIKVLQIWVDPKYPDAHRDPALRRYLIRMWYKEGFQALIRYNEIDGIFLYYDGYRFYEKTLDRAHAESKTHDAREIVNAIGEYKLSLFKP